MHHHSPSCNCGQQAGQSAGLFILGALAGAAAALLFAPKSGSETREDLKHMAQKAQDELSKKKDLLKQTGKDVADTIRKNIRDAEKEM